MFDYTVWYVSGCSYENILFHLTVDNENAYGNEIKTDSKPNKCKKRKEREIFTSENLISEIDAISWFNRDDAWLL